jgi:hypothetical protein
MVARLGVAAKLGFKAHPHMFRHACGFQLANQGTDTRTLQAYLGHRNIQHTVRYTELSPTRFKNLARLRIVAQCDLRYIGLPRDRSCASDRPPEGSARPWRERQLAGRAGVAQTLTAPPSKWKRRACARSPPSPWSLPQGCVQARRSGSRPHPERSRTIFIAAARCGILLAQSPFPLLARRMLRPVGSTYPTHGPDGQSPGAGGPPM